MRPQEIAKETAQVIQNYLTYKAVQLVVAQLAETNPRESIWLRQYSSGGKLRDAETYLQEIMSEPRGKELAMRIMTVRLDIAEKTLEFLPEMVSAGIQADNLTQRRHLLERLTQTSGTGSDPDAPQTNGDENSD